MSIRKLALLTWILVPVAAAAETELPVAGNELVEHAPIGPSDWKIAPEFAIAAPQPLVIGIEAASATHPNLRGFSNIGYFRFPFSGGSKSVNEFTAQFGARYFPFQSWFFGSLSLGYRHIGVSADLSNFSIAGETVVTNGDIDLYTFFSGFAVGGSFPLSDRLRFGFDVGVQVPIVGWGRMSLVDQTSGANSENSDLLSTGDQTAMNRISKILVPQITLFRLTWTLD